MDVLLQANQETIDVLRRVVDKIEEKHGCVNTSELWEEIRWYVGCLQSTPRVCHHETCIVSRLQCNRQMLLQKNKTRDKWKVSWM